MYHIFESHIETNNKNKCIVYFRLFQISNNLIIFRIFRIWFKILECRIYLNLLSAFEFIPSYLPW